MVLRDFFQKNKISRCRWPNYCSFAHKQFIKFFFIVSLGVAGFLAAFWSSLALCPTELVKCRLQAMREAYTSQGQQPPRIGPYQLTRSDIVNSVVVVNF